ncbi:hypothetical protein ATK30_7581 [Amycolatopsis echigonensis]|uniref:Uncharacterized protein n=1 Tax=Amycolatopsis echigonensis TaxID=2576905 RepID=A0A2N3WRY5_9PSEU|nr:hypothetical protein ATK30_7581 [Amycolatopsis niigatensis]
MVRLRCALRGGRVWMGLGGGPGPAALRAPRRAGMDGRRGPWAHDGWGPGGQVCGGVAGKVRRRHPESPRGGSDSGPGGLVPTTPLLLAEPSPADRRRAAERLGGSRAGRERRRRLRVDARSRMRSGPRSPHAAFQPTARPGSTPPLQPRPPPERSPTAAAPPGSGTRPDRAGPARFQAPGSRLQAPGSRLQAPGSRLQAPGSRLQAPGDGLTRRARRPPAAARRRTRGSGPSHAPGLKATSFVVTVPAVRPGAAWWVQYRFVCAMTCAGGGAPHVVRSPVVWASLTRVAS